MSIGRPRGRLLWRLALAIPLWVAIAPTVLAYNQLIPPGGLNAIGSCTGASGSPCYHWAKTAGNLSINVDVYLEVSLVGQEVDLRAESLAAMTQYNQIKARNPRLQQTTANSNEETYVSAANLSDPTIYGGTSFIVNDTTGLITYTTIRFNTLIEWNLSYNYDCRFVAGGNEVCKADAAKVLRHEFGHSEGLAHIGTSVGVMVQHEPTAQYHHLQTDDKNGIIHIYGAYP